MQMEAQVTAGSEENPRTKSKGRRSTERAYYQMLDSSRGESPFEFVNCDVIQKDKPGLGVPLSDPWPDGWLRLPRGPWRFPEYTQTPRLLLTPKRGSNPPDLWCFDGFWVVSKKMKTVFETVDPGACDYRPCEVVLPSGETGPERWLCTVTRAFVGAVDEAASRDLEIWEGRDGKRGYSWNLTTELRLKSNVVGSAHLFRVAEMYREPLGDQIMKEACSAAGIKGLRFRAIGTS